MALAWVVRESGERERKRARARERKGKKKKKAITSLKTFPNRLLPFDPPFPPRPSHRCPGDPLTEVPKAQQCPAGSTTLGAEGSGSLANCVIPPGSYLDPFGQVKVCERNFWCPGGPYDQAPGRTPCGAGNTTFGATGSTNAGACGTIDPW